MNVEPHSLVIACKICGEPVRVLWLHRSFSWYLEHAQQAILIPATPEDEAAAMYDAWLASVHLNTADVLAEAERILGKANR